MSSFEIVLMLLGTAVYFMWGTRKVKRDGWLQFVFGAMVIFYTLLIIVVTLALLFQWAVTA